MRPHVTRGARTVARGADGRRAILRGGRYFGRGKRVRDNKSGWSLNHAAVEEGYATASELWELHFIWAPALSSGTLKST